MREEAARRNSRKTGRTLLHLVCPLLVAVEVAAEYRGVAPARTLVEHTLVLLGVKDDLGGFGRVVLAVDLRGMSESCG